MSINKKVLKQLAKEMNSLSKRSAFNQILLDSKIRQDNFSIAQQLGFFGLTHDEKSKNRQVYNESLKSIVDEECAQVVKLYRR